MDGEGVSQTRLVRNHTNTRSVTVSSDMFAFAKQQAHSSLISLPLSLQLMYSLVSTEVIWSPDARIDLWSSCQTAQRKCPAGTRGVKVIRKNWKIFYIFNHNIFYALCRSALCWNFINIEKWSRNANISITLGVQCGAVKLRFRFEQSSVMWVNDVLQSVNSGSIDTNKTRKPAAVNVLLALMSWIVSC